VEDLDSCTRMGAQARHFSIPDCIYRRSGADNAALYASEAEIFGPVHPEESWLVSSLSTELAMGLPEQAILVSPLSLGGHADHRLTRQAAELLNLPLYYYADYPYAEAWDADLSGLIPDGWELDVHPVSAQGLSAWCAAVAAHRSQISTFWAELEGMQSSIREYYSRFGGVRLWRQRLP
jgi:hypothetical protein